MQHLTARVTGNVQGVGFRYRTKQIADQMGIKGYAKNLPDGSVEIVACGTQTAIDVFLKEVTKVFSQNIQDIQIVEREGQGSFTEFLTL